MKKVIFGVFAHPDDEAFGPAGALLVERDAGSDIHLVVLTSGQSGANPDGHNDLGDVRLGEWKRSCDALGAASTHHMGYEDGHLSNVDMIEIAKRLEEIIRPALSTYDNDIEVEIMCFDLNGLTGHIDHIVASRAACLAYYRLKVDEPRMKRIRLFCLPSTVNATSNVDWLYMEPGRTENEISDIVDARAHARELKQIIAIHHTQRHDGEQYLSSQGESLGLTHFITLE